MTSTSMVKKINKRVDLQKGIENIHNSNASSGIPYVETINNDDQ